MPEFDKNAAYIWACFGLGALMILATTLQVILAARAARRRLAALEPGPDGDA
ncbi:MAG: heme exporter protein CcmD [Hyphomonas sp.]|jgi:heme exporter protein CcmD|uniref:heme exporter protein CcmD n=1 Tax=Hyphomonas sp. TaxID=87 RepID=UPI0018063C27|nr:heme exporter protein CcmD [Hyphomonas sp.]MBU3920945.1 heme exporter protein CcmD [Alphaproteobacteria bacterium]MBA3068620.1 heme exporter protein CcmD [Hyphomonas sp.]MBU4061939.1 heme exporter protein CcmD [Alphaproteobacteria bacterium]MBU4166094.1 heme exporter protein CcmD [Alphaproteobacteria bacterium]MBU4568664.1 heme exporter protein CcmD [Alphaproteobacteria bacterium]